MQLAFLENVQATLQRQYVQLVGTPVPDDKLAQLHSSGIEIRGALQLIGQLITHEKTALAAPPGAMGPGIE